MATLKVPDRVGDLGAYLKDQRETARLSLRQLASVAGVSNPYLSQIERGLRKPSAEVLQQIAKGLQISAEALFLRAGLLEHSGGLEVEVAIQSELHLTARQKRVLLDIYSTFRAENARAVAEAAGAAAVADAVAAGLEVERVAERANDDEGGTRTGRRAKVVPLKSAESLKSAGPDADADGGGIRRRAAGGVRARGVSKRAAAKRTTKAARSPRKAT